MYEFQIKIIKIFSIAVYPQMHPVCEYTELINTILGITSVKNRLIHMKFDALLI